MNSNIRSRRELDLSKLVKFCLSQLSTSFNSQKVGLSSKFFTQILNII